MRAEDNIGQRYGCYTIIGVSNAKAADGHRKYIAQCYCGEIVETSLSTIKRVNKCRHKIYINNKSFLLPKFQSVLLRQIYRSMLYRCYNPRAKDYKYYGAKVYVFVMNGLTILNCLNSGAMKMGIVIIKGYQ